MAGIAALRQPAHKAANLAQQALNDARSPVVATLFGLIPGLGAAYNGQNIKSLVQFLIPVSLWQLGDIFSGGGALPFILGGTAFYIFSLYDAYRSAKRARAGLDLQVEDEALKRLLQQHTTEWGVLLVLVGALTVLHRFFPTQFVRFWPFLLIGAGLALVRWQQHQRQQPAAPNLTATPAPPLSVIGAPYERQESNLVNAEHRFEHWRQAP